MAQISWRRDKWSIEFAVVSFRARIRAMRENEAAARAAMGPQRKVKSIVFRDLECVDIDWQAEVRDL